MYVNIIDEAVNLIKSMDSLAVLTGAGVSQESGVPTFRGNDGLWGSYKAEDLATPSAFKRNPHLVWEWYNWRREIIRGCKPNKAHIAIVELEKMFKSFLLITQNVDGLHKRAGSRNIIELYGNIWISVCSVCKDEVVSECTFETIDFKEIKSSDEMGELLPLCKKCGGILRPGVVWFGEAVPEEKLGMVYNFLSEVKMMLVIGTSGIVQPAATLPFFVKENGGRIHL